MAEANGLTIGVSNTFRKVTQTHTAYEQARDAARLGGPYSKIMSEGLLYRYHDVAYLHMLEITGKMTNLLSLCHPSILRLASQDEAHGSEYLETLFCYLQVAGSTTRAAKLLSLHKNTMLYRLGRIREIVGLDPSNGEDVFVMQASLRIMIALGLFTPRVRLGGGPDSKS
jgi:DNA-binding PucR family transcriptional regulator